MGDRDAKSEAMHALRCDVDQILWRPTDGGGITGTWRGRMVMILCDGDLSEVRVDSLTLSRGADARSLFRQAEEILLSGLVDNFPHCVGRMLVVGSSWCCAVEVSEVLVAEHGYVTSYFRGLPEPDVATDPADFRMSGGRMLIGGVSRAVDSVPIVSVYQALIDAFLRGGDVEKIDTDWERACVVFDSRAPST